MDKLGMIMAYAKLEGLNATYGERCVFVHGKCDLMGTPTIDKYNPITNLHINCEARDKYKTEVDYYHGRVEIFNDEVNVVTPAVSVHFNKVEDVSIKVIECILKYHELWIEEK